MCIVLHRNIFRLLQLLSISTTQDALSRSEASARIAAEHLASNLNLLHDPFLICLVTYALHIAGHPMRGIAFQIMESVRFQGKRTNFE